MEAPETGDGISGESTMAICETIHVLLSGWLVALPEAIPLTVHRTVHRNDSRGAFRGEPSRVVLPCAPTVGRL